jgi:hypothetical protein
MAPVTDPVLARRARIAHWCALGKRVGYALYAAAVVLFFVGLAVGYDGGIATAIVLALLVGGAALIPSIVFAYGVKAAEREEREQGGFSGRR